MLSLSLSKTSLLYSISSFSLPRTPKRTPRFTLFLIGLMGSGDQSQIPHEPTTQPPPPSEHTAADAPQNPHPHPPPSKIPFRPRKIRRLSTTNLSSNTSDDKSQQHPKPLNVDASNSLSKITQPTTKSRKRNATQSTWVLPELVKSLSSEGEVDIALRYLKDSDPLLSVLIEAHLPPSFDSYQPPFLALAKSIIHQQLAIKAGQAIFTRLISLCGGESAVVPDTVLSLSAQQLRQIGISGRKASYLHDLSNKYKSGILSDASILEMDDKSLFTMLTMVKGIGPWSVHMFMIFSLHRPDVLPVGDLIVRKGVQLLHNLKELPKPSQMEELCEKWKPYRSVGSWYMWRLVEAKGAPPVATAVAPLMDGVVAAEQQQMQPQLLEPMSGIGNLGAWIGGQ